MAMITTTSETPARVDGREERGDRTANALVLAARKAFAERGFAGASVRDIARAANANPALIRYHFGSKEGLYQRVNDAYVNYLGREGDEGGILGWVPLLESDPEAFLIAFLSTPEYSSQLVAI